MALIFCITSLQIREVIKTTLGESLWGFKDGSWLPHTPVALSEGRGSNSESKLYICYLVGQVEAMGQDQAILGRNLPNGSVC